MTNMVHLIHGHMTLQCPQAFINTIFYLFEAMKQRY